MVWGRTHRSMLLLLLQITLVFHYFIPRQRIYQSTSKVMEYIRVTVCLGAPPQLRVLLPVPRRSPHALRRNRSTCNEYLFANLKCEYIIITSSLYIQTTQNKTGRWKSCRQATWRGMLQILKMGRKGGSRAVGVSNFEEEHLMDLMDVVSGVYSKL